MHPYSPHAQSAASRRKVPVPPAPVRSARMVAAGTPMSSRTRMRLIADPLDMLAAEVTAKVDSSYAAAHVAAEELKLRRPRRPAARRAGFRTPPS